MAARSTRRKVEKPMKKRDARALVAMHARTLLEADASNNEDLIHRDKYGNEYRESDKKKLADAWQELLDWLDAKSELKDPL
jgi:hypothetical protein